MSDCRIGCRSADDCDGSCRAKDHKRELRKLSALVNRLGVDQKRKLHKKAAQGYRGWDDPNWTIEQIKAAIIEHVKKGDPVDVANFAAFWFRRQE